MELLLHLGYLFSLLALSVRDILWLRCFLAVAHCSLITHAVLTGNKEVAFWHTVFVSINAWRIFRLIRERAPLNVPADLRDVYESVFSVMSPREFLYLWETGSKRRTEDTTLIRQGAPLGELLLILSGACRVERDRRELARLTRGSFLAEMSFLSGQPASADVIADGAVEYLSWDQEKLQNLDILNPALMIKLQGILGKDLVKKLRATSDRAAGEDRGL